MANVAVFCSSSDKISPSFFDEIATLGRGLAEGGHSIVYGGARVGLMGRVADSCLAAGGEVFGVIPDYLNQPGITHEGLTDLQIVDTLLDRKRIMIEKSDVVLVFPGGIGTLDELTEALALEQLQQLNPEVVILNYLDFYQPLLDYFVELQERGMISQDLESLYKVFDSSNSFLTWLNER
ncbi:MAG: TIGR00730 family Rossman fold protein [Bdellovibrionales bacterium]|nr:TIGR00730 family Rossman fold protein [Bdellovibrionales bacterium]